MYLYIYIYKYMYVNVLVLSQTESPSRVVFTQQSPSARSQNTWTTTRMALQVAPAFTLGLQIARSRSNLNTPGPEVGIIYGLGALGGLLQALIASSADTFLGLKALNRGPEGSVCIQQMSLYITYYRYIYMYACMCMYMYMRTYILHR